jgi:hypothetical protein
VTIIKRILLGIVALICVLIAVVLIVWGWRVVFNWIEVHTGTVNESGPYYGFWSGFGSDLGEVTLVAAVLAGVYGAYRRHNCQDPKCWRLGKHPSEGGTFIFCHHHHPDLSYAAGRKMTLIEMHEHHHESRKRHTTLTSEQVEQAAETAFRTVCGSCGAPIEGFPCPHCGAGGEVPVEKVLTIGEQGAPAGSTTVTTEDLTALARVLKDGTPQRSPIQGTRERREVAAAKAAKTTKKAASPTKRATPAPAKKAAKKTTKGTRS